MKGESNNNVIIFLVLLLGILFILGCSSSSGPDISIENAWGRSLPRAATNGAFYMIIKNEGGDTDRLIAGESEACTIVELHESFETEEGAMGMRPVEGGAIEVPAGGQAELKIGGLHIMCIDKLEEFEAGAVLPLTLRFEKSGQIYVDVEIREP